MVLCLKIDATGSTTSPSIKHLATAALIYIYLVFFETPNKLRIIGLMVERMHKLIISENTINPGIAGNIWALTIGGIASAGWKEQNWFVGRWAESALHISDLDLREELSRFVWCSMLNKKLEELRAEARLHLNKGW
jgi:hypothetical protein